MRGRKPLPSKIIELRGGTRYTHRPARTKEPQPPERLPPCPRHLDRVARKEWRRAGKILMGLRMITELDRAVLAVYCQAWSEWTLATIQLGKGLVYRRNDGSPGINPHMRIAREAADRIIRTAGELGLSVTARARIKVEMPKPAGKVAAFMGRKNGAQG